MLAQPSRQFVRIRLLSLCCVADLVKKPLRESVCSSFRDLTSFRECVQLLYRNILRRDLASRPLLESMCKAFIEMLPRDLLERACAEIFYRDPAKKPVLEILHTDLAGRSHSHTGILPRDLLVYRGLCRDLLQRPCVEILPRGRLQRFCQETSYRESLCRDFLHRSWYETSYRDL